MEFDTYFLEVNFKKKIQLKYVLMNVKYSLKCKFQLVFSFSSAKDMCHTLLAHVSHGTQEKYTISLILKM